MCLLRRFAEMRVQPNQSFIVFQLRIAEKVEHSRARTQAVINEIIGEALAQQEQAAARRQAQTNAEWLGRVLDEKA
ncbi:hypothetical protein Oter_1097 [Opitutus terrae PB90-1]|uniref:Uncharacterized protein n=2 Tax=Opitutus terrae TaxID=107709 RepID=B1ZMP1_OPITP|nr:hypothetical protein Oter_1097 [Opitutus terrae PB90-1]